MKKLIVTLVVVFYCTATYTKEPICNVYTRGGQYVAIIVTDSITGGAVVVGAELRYNSTSIRTNQETNVTTINCNGPGQTPCPPCPSASVPPVVYDEIIGKLRNDIDWGHTAGEFSIENLVCTWDDGSKEIQVLDGIEYPIYSYNLEIASIVDETLVVSDDLEITVFPNPVHNHLTVRFSTPVSSMVNMKIVAIDGDVHWTSDVHVSGDVFVLPAAVVNDLQTGMYYVICTNGDNAAYASFLKR